MSRMNSKSPRPRKRRSIAAVQDAGALVMGDPTICQVLQCAAAAALWISQEVHDPDPRSQGREGSL